MNPTGIYRKGMTRILREQIRVFCYEQALKSIPVRTIAVMAAEHFGRSVTKSFVHDLINEEITAQKQPLAEARRQLELDKIDAIERRLHEELDAIDIGAKPMEVARLELALLRAQERRSKFQGMDAPVQFSSDTTVHYTIDGVDLENLR